MRKIAVTAAAAALMVGPLLTGAAAHAAQSSNNTTTYGPDPTPVIQPLDCTGTTGAMGCGPGWFWRNGDAGWKCYPC
jgi:hypothetical protein